MPSLILKRASASCSSGEWKEDDYHVIADSKVVGRIFHAAASPVGQPWMWTLIFGYHEDRARPRTATNRREAAMAAFAISKKRWSREAAMRVCVAMAVALMLVGASVPASALTSGQLLAQCEQLEPWQIQGKEVRIRSIDAGVCWGYLRAYFDLAYLVLSDPSEPNAPHRPLLACPPSGVSFVQFARMFLQKARNNPARLHEDAMFMIINMLIENFPCPKQ
jgi:hypothetical protein